MHFVHVYVHESNNLVQKRVQKSTKCAFRARIRAQIEQFDENRKKIADAMMYSKKMRGYNLLFGIIFKYTNLLFLPTPLKNRLHVGTREIVCVMRHGT